MRRPPRLFELYAGNSDGRAGYAAAIALHRDRDYKDSSRRCRSDDCLPAPSSMLAGPTFGSAKSPGAPEPPHSKPEIRSCSKLPAMSSCAKPVHFATCVLAPGRVPLICSYWPRSRVGLPRPRPFPAARRIRQRITDTQTFLYFRQYEFASPDVVDNDFVDDRVPAQPAVPHGMC